MAIKKITKTLLDTSLQNEIDNKLSASTAATTYRSKSAQITFDDLNAAVRSGIMNGQNIVGYDDSELRSRVINAENTVSSFGGVDDFFQKGSDKVTEPMLDDGLVAKINSGVGSNDFLATQIAEIQSLKADKTAIQSYRAKIDPIVEVDLGIALANKINAGPTELQNRMTDVENNKASTTYIDTTFRKNNVKIQQVDLTDGLSSRIDHSYNTIVDKTIDAVLVPGLETKVDALRTDVDVLVASVGAGTAGLVTTGEFNTFKNDVQTDYVPFATYTPEVNTKMDKSANLSDLDSVAISRANLGIVSRVYNVTVATMNNVDVVLSFGPEGALVPVEDCIWTVLVKEDIIDGKFRTLDSNMYAAEQGVNTLRIYNNTAASRDFKLKIALINIVE